MKIKTYASTFVAATLGLMSAIPAHALGLGNIELSSALNEPFRAEISISSLSENEAGNLQVQLASNDEFERAGLIKSSVLLQLKFDIKQKDGKTIISVTSKDAVKEPLLDFLLSVTTGSGHLIREYTVLLDPPKSIFREKVASQPVATSPKRSVKQPAPTQYQYSEPSFTPYSATEYTVRTNDTLWNIALNTKPEDSVSVHQMMMALLKENGSAFIRNNINGLKAGQTLSIPTADEVKQLTQAQARAAVKEQNNLWKNGNSAPEPVVTEADISAGQPTTEPENTVVEVPVVKDTVEPVSRLQLLSPDEESLLGDEALSGPGGEQIQSLIERLTFAQETIDNQALENTKIKERMAAMEEQIQTLRKLVSIQDPSLAKLQSKLEEEGELESDSSLEKLSDDILAALTDEEVNVDQQQAVAEIEDQNSDDVTSEPDDKLPAEVGIPVAEQATDLTLTEDATEPQAEVTQDQENSAASEMATPKPVSWLDKAKSLILENKIESMSAALVLLIALLLLGRRNGGAGLISRREKTWDEALKEIENDVQIPNFTRSQTPAKSAVASEDTENDAVKTVDDLIKDADIYVSYGDLDKAKLALEEAAKDEPDNKLVMHKLLFVLFKQGSAAQFVELAGKFETEPDSLEWLEISSWGRAIAPDNVLFKEAVTEQVDEAPASATDNDLDNELSDEDDVPEFDLTETTFEAVPNTTEEDDLLAFDPGFVSDFDAIEQSNKTDDSDDESQDDTVDKSLSFDLASDDDLTNLEFDIAEAQVEDSKSAISDDLELLEVSKDDLNKATQTLEIDSDSDDLEFDLGEFDQVDESETKIDLASAYIDMGDPEGAKNILREVLNEGSDDQKTRAQAILDDLT